MIDLTPGQHSATEWLHATKRKAKAAQEAKDAQPSEMLAKTLAECLTRLPDTQHALFYETLRTTALDLVAKMLSDSSAPLQEVE